ncbi:helix-turn-helix transcriptional regulator [Pseudonocardia sp. HH130629-09]|uniref:helix-turn-helix transcriptional regulator n=1 Tax=Pseudonocardia sp. HH130629-09 TaxID=1641402 RepID=UPI0006CB25B7|nr:XRE family transcriptional regulator [Pseudonocardia sp. HH130629-09]
MDQRQQIRQFLISRRARLTPEAVGLPTPAGHRRVPGLRREEAATLAGVSVDYYTRLERGTATGVSDSVLQGLCRALALDDAERAHLSDLLRAATATTVARQRRLPSRQISPSMQRVLDSMITSPAFVTNSRLDLVATNSLCAALYADLDDHTGSAVNLARYTFLDPRALDFYPEWDTVAEMTVALLRSSAGHDPLDRDLSDLIGELVTRSDEFRTRWAAHHVQHHTSGHKRFHHPVVGDLELAFDSMDHAADPTLTMTVYTAEPGSPSADALTLLGTWTAPVDRARGAH